MIPFLFLSFFRRVSACVYLPYLARKGEREKKGLLLLSLLLFFVERALNQETIRNFQAMAKRKGKGGKGCRSEIRQPSKKKNQVLRLLWFPFLSCCSVRPNFEIASYFFLIVSCGESRTILFSLALWTSVVGPLLLVSPFFLLFLLPQLMPPHLLLLKREGVSSSSNQATCSLANTGTEKCTGRTKVDSD